MNSSPERRTATIALLPGDGIGPEVVDAAREVLERVADRFGYDFTFRKALIGATAIKQRGTPLPDETIDICREADAVFLGAVGGTWWEQHPSDMRPEQGLLGIRRELGLFANLRPVAVFPELARFSPFRPDHVSGVDILVVRELTGGIYFGEKATESDASGERATDVCAYTTGEVERIARVAGDAARMRKGHVTSVDKANVLETSRLWRRVVTRVMAEEYPDVRVDHMLVDSCAMKLVMHPSDFDVIVTENMFGDILTDEAAVLAGSIGLLPSASFGHATPGATRAALYEPIHGSAPDIAGCGVANPVGAILSAAMLARYSLGLDEAADAIERAVRRTVSDGVLTPDVVPLEERPGRTADVTAHIISQLGTRHIRPARPARTAVAAD